MPNMRTKDKGQYRKPVGFVRPEGTRFSVLCSRSEYPWRGHFGNGLIGGGCRRWLGQPLDQAHQRCPRGALFLQPNRLRERLLQTLAKVAYDRSAQGRAI